MKKIKAIIHSLPNSCVMKSQLLKTCETNEFSKCLTAAIGESKDQHTSELLDALIWANFHNTERKILNP
jgi:hypothetical protein